VTFKIMTTSVNKTVFHNTTPDLHDQDQDRLLLVSDRSCPETDGVRPHHWLFCVVCSVAWLFLLGCQYQCK